MKKKLITFMFVFVLLLTSSAYATDSGIKVTIDGQEMVFTDNLGYPMMSDNRVLLPLRQVFEKFGWQLSYDAASESIFGIKDNQVMGMQVGSFNYFIAGKQKTFDVAPMIVNDRTLVPIRVIAEALGNDVNWDDANQTVIITSKK